MHVQLHENVCFICWHLFLIWLMHTISKIMMPCSLLKLASSFYLASIHNACSHRKQSLTYGSFPPYFHNKFRFGMVSHGNQALIILQIPENSGILMSILELFPLSAWVPIIIWNFWKPTDITQLKYSTASSSLYTLLQCTYLPKYMLSIYLRIKVL